MTKLTKGKIIGKNRVMAQYKYIGLFRLELL